MMRIADSTVKLAALFFIAGANLLSESSARAGCDPGVAAQEMLEAEERFIFLTREQGIRDATLAFLAPGAVAFDPGPVDAAAMWNARPAEDVAVRWAPTFSGMASSCDLGFTSGPVEWRAPAADRGDDGHYVTIWKNVEGERWKIALQITTQNPRLAKENAALEISTSRNPLPNDSAAFIKTRTALAAAQQKFAGAARFDSTAALLGSAREDVRVFRQGSLPALGRDAARVMLSVRRGALSLERIGGDTSAAGDLAYDYGRYVLRRGEGSERGHYLQVWRADEKGGWRIAVDLLAAPAAPERSDAEEADEFLRQRAPDNR